MLKTIIEGVVLGLGLCFFIGPVFIALLHTSIKRGFKSGVFFALGVIISDMFCVTLTYLGFSQITANEEYQFWIGIGGGIVLMVFGTYEFFHKEKVKIDIDAAYAPKLTLYVLKGFLLNIATPFVFLFWLGAVGLVSAKYGDSQQSVIIFFLSVGTTIFSTDILKSFVANKLTRFLTEKNFFWIRKIAGLLMFIFGIILIWKAW
jgi:threonine/homoserine/homoserine lactone efflux protein